MLTAALGHRYDMGKLGILKIASHHASALGTAASLTSNFRHSPGRGLPGSFVLAASIS